MRSTKAEVNTTRMDNGLNRGMECAGDEALGDPGPYSEKGVRDKDSSSAEDGEGSEEEWETGDDEDEGWLKGRGRTFSGWCLLGTARRSAIRKTQKVRGEGRKCDQALDSLSSGGSRLLVRL